jgi:hypothetical protein
MKNTLYILIFTLFGGLSGYSYNRFTLNIPIGMYKEQNMRVGLKGDTLEYIFSDIKIDHYLLKLKSTAHKQSWPKLIYFNNYPLKFQWSKHFSSKGIVLSEIPTSLISKDSNILKVAYPDIISSSVLITLRNYRKELSGGKLFILFKSSNLFSTFEFNQKNRRNLKLILLGIFITAGTALIIYLFLSPFGLPIPTDSFLKMETICITPGFTLLLLLNLVSVFSPYQFIINKSYFLQIIFVPIFLLQLFLIYAYSEQKKITPPRIKKETAFSFKYALACLRGKLLSYEVADRFIILFIFFLLLCAMLLILKMDQLAEVVGNFAYLLIIIGTVIKLTQFNR